CFFLLDYNAMRYFVANTGRFFRYLIVSTKGASVWLGFYFPLDLANDGGRKQTLQGLRASGQTQ
ncbi:MAG TPA: hypothetical protein PKB13_11495, partial [Clostridia bacterium]|nr:hypothetical protein [Clostridia bacterium]